MQSKMKYKNIFGTCLYKEIGASHRLYGKRCEDSVARAFVKETGVTAVVVSDGAGSCKHADVGSSIVAETAVKLVSEKFELIWKLDEETSAKYMINEICIPINRVACENNWLPESMYATLVCLAVHPDGRFIIFHIGDGAVVGYEPQDGFTVLSQYNHIGAMNETTFVNVPKTSYNLVRSKCKYASFMLMSDGPEPFLVPPGIVTIRVSLMQQIAFVMSERQMEKQMASLTEYLCNECFMHDDSSFALLTDYRRIKDVIDDMSPVLRNDVLAGAEKMSKKKFNEYVSLIQSLQESPYGLTYKQIGRILKNKHKIRIIKNYLRNIFPEGFIEEFQGRVYLK